MKAIRMHKTGDPGVLQLEEVPKPAAGPGQVLVRIRAVGVNPVETYIRAGRYPSPPLPLTPGTDAAGNIESVGAGVTRVGLGDRVYTSGTVTGAYAEYAVCDESRVHHLPDKLSYEEGAAVNIPCATAYRALFQKARALPGETVLIHGASGGVGNVAVQLARAAGLRIIGTAGSDRGLSLVREAGAHAVLDHRTPEYLAELDSLTGGRGVDVVLEMLADVNLARDLTVLARGGRVVVIGSRGTVEINPRELMAREAVVLGMVLFNAPEAERASIHAALGSALDSGVLRPVIGRKLPLAEAARAHEAVLEPGAYGKIILLP